VKFNPFRPGKIVAPGMFAGRWKHIVDLKKILNQTKHGNAQHFALIGERGIGKSSLLMLFQSLATGGVKLDTDEDPDFSFLVVNMDLEPNTSYVEIVRRAGASLKRAADELQPKKAKAKKVLSFLSKWEVLGVKFDQTQGNVTPQELLDQLIDSVTETLAVLREDVEGIVFLIDEADKPPATSHLGEFCKLFTERLTKRNCHQVCFGLAGLPGLITKLRDSHESSPRIFDVMTLEPLLGEDAAHVVKRGMDEANKKNTAQTKITPAATELIVDQAEGYPHFIQQFAFCAFEANSDDTIDFEDVQRGMPDAIQQLGNSYFNDLYFDRIASEDYRAVLRTMAEHGDAWMTKETLRASSVSETQLKNAIATLKQRNIIVVPDGQKGVYRLPTKAFAVWLKSLTKAGK